MALAIVTLLHVLVFVYWLGGDVGAFYASTILTDARQPAAARAAAAKVLNNVDMAPRTALILALPTGLTLAVVKSWVVAPAWVVAAIWILALVWLAIAWTIHLRHSPASASLRQIDLAIRWIALASLLGLALAGHVGEAVLPLFIRFKLAILASAMVAGLLIRVTLAPFGPAFGEMMKHGATPQTDAIIARALTLSRPVVLVLWALLLAAALLGLATPV